jgi:hypothetical protein
LFSEFRVFREKPVTRVDRVDIRNFRSADDTVGTQITVRAPRASNTDCFVSQLNVKRLNVGLRIDGQCLYAQFTTGPNDAKSDFTAIRDEDFLYHLK